MAPIEIEIPAPTIRGVSFKATPLALLFYKVTCPVCQMAAPAYSRLNELSQGRVIGIGQDPAPRLKDFAAEWGLNFPAVPDLDPFPASTAYGIEVVPTLVLVGPRERLVLDVVQSWDRAGVNRLAMTLTELAGLGYHEVSSEGDGLPAFRPG